MSVAFCALTYLGLFCIYLVYIAFVFSCLFCILLCTWVEICHHFHDHFQALAS